MRTPRGSRASRRRVLVVAPSFHGVRPAAPRLADDVGPCLGTNGFARTAPVGPARSAPSCLPAATPVAGTTRTRVAGLLGPVTTLALVARHGLADLLRGPFASPIAVRPVAPRSVVAYALRRPGVLMA